MNSSNCRGGGVHARGGGVVRGKNLEDLYRIFCAIFFFSSICVVEYKVLFRVDFDFGHNGSMLGWG